MTPAVPVPIDQRFAQLIKQFGLTKNSFAISLGKTASVVQHLIDGRNKPGYDLLCKVFEIYPNVSRDWLLLGRGPMLVSGEHAPKPITIATPRTPELPLEPIELSDVELPTARRTGVAGSRLQPAEIAATLALAAGTAQAALTNGTALPPPPAAETRAATTFPEPAVADAQLLQPPATAQAPVRAEAASVAPESLPIPPLATPAPAPQPVVASANPPAPTVGPGPETYIAAALHAQHLQHQLAVAEMRNQHLLEQQQMLREMLAMARQSMV